MMTADKIFKIIDEAETYAVPVEFDGDRKMHVIFLIGKVLVFAVIYAAELISKSIKNSS